MKKLIFVAAMLLCLSLTLSACSSYRDDVAVTNLASAVFEAVTTQGGYTAADADYVSLEFANASVIDSNVSEWMICASTSSQTVDEFGIFHVKADGDISAVKQEVESYVQALQVKLEVYLENYAPSEKTKLQNAQVFVFGNYVVFTMLTDEDTAAVKTAVQTSLKK